MATDKNTAPVARLIVATIRALNLYEAGVLPGALAALDGHAPAPLPDRPEWIASELERRAAGARSGPVPAAALDWVGLARDRLRQEIGEPVRFAVVPVPLALRSALGCLGA
jgi:hypothetical protein